MKNKKALVILSGGQDSVTCLYWAKKQFEEVQAITFAYGQNHDVEVDLAKEICENLKVEHKVVDISFLPTLVESALTSEGDVNELNDLGLPASFVPNRNQLFITLSHSFAQKIGASVLVTGVCQTDYSGYADCRRDYIDVIEFACNKGSGLLTSSYQQASKEDGAIEIVTPLMYLDKAQTFALADELGCLEVIIEDTITCYNGDTTENAWGMGCGECPACTLRKKGYEKFLKDKV